MPEYTRRRTLAALSGIGASFLAGCNTGGSSTPADDPPGTTRDATASGSWPMFQRAPERSGRHRGTGPTSLSQQWSRELDHPIRQSPVVADGTIYCTTETNELLMIDAGNGDQTLRKSLNSVSGSPVIAGSRVLVSGAKLAALSADGSRAWTGDMKGEPVTAPLVANGTVYVGSSDTRVYALSLNDGSRRWRTVPVDATITAPPAASGGWTYVPTEIGLLAHDKDGTREWDALDETVPVSPAVYDGWAYAGRTDGVVEAFDARTGESQWAMNLPAGVAAAPAVNDTGVYVADLDRNLSRLHLRSGGVAWQAGLSAQPQHAPAITSNALYTGVGDRVVAYSTSEGTELWSASHVGASGTAVAFANNALYVAGIQRLAKYR